MLGHRTLSSFLTFHVKLMLQRDMAVFCDCLCSWIQSQGALGGGQMWVCCSRGSRCVSVSPKPRWQCCVCVPWLSLGPHGFVLCWHCWSCFNNYSHTFFCWRWIWQQHRRPCSFGGRLRTWWHRWKDPQVSRGMCQVELVSQSAVSSSIGFYHTSDLMGVKKTTSQERQINKHVSNKCAHKAAHPLH